MSQPRKPISDPKVDKLINNMETNSQPKRWDSVHHAPLCDDRTNELICIYLELIRLTASIQPAFIYQETLEPMATYAVRRLNEMFGTNIELRIKEAPAVDPQPSTVTIN